MQLRSTPFLLALAAGMASAADLRGYFEGNCGGGYLQCGNVGAGTCCIILRENGLRGSPSIAVVFAGTGTQLFGYQRTRDGNSCGSIAAQKATGGLSYTCLDIPAGTGEFSGTRWYPPGLFLKRSPATSCAPTSTEECTGLATPDLVVLNDGHAFGLTGVDDATTEVLYAFAANGSTVADLPESVAGLEVDGEGVEARVRMMRN
ncbi:hypothetical protein BU26DRAFT_565196 [Trematosphaeria pertusa]|uniref:Secreted protein n=1 Tax=Trematosphaeria pertusa TaxID=390896 RepID=A0A6A6IG49_9PLEO|nr:uncharacterized protein BU26DRAFT_565196 [Trematosphaeria pertusa]KAF2249555.1 hypothetical protein BU26DRAFT_565196 [Trematosphaeria pertusa]